MLKEDEFFALSLFFMKELITDKEKFDDPDESYMFPMIIK